MASTIYLDEAGNSGQNLLDRDQPIFVLASNDFSIEEANVLLELVRSSQESEPKFRTLRKSRDGLRRLARFLNSPNLTPDRVIWDAFHKRYMIITKLVDLIAETVANEMGFDLYRDGANIAMSNMLYYCLPSFCGLELTDRWLASFVVVMRNRDARSIEQFYNVGAQMVEAAKQSSEPKFVDDLSPFVRVELLPVWYPGIGDQSLEPAIPALFEHIATWGGRKEERFEVIHDNSKPILASQEFFAIQMAKANEASKWIGYDRRKFRYPLRATKLSQADSILHPQIQVADLCAGAAAYYLKTWCERQSDETSELIKETRLLELAINGVVPHPEVEPTRLGTSDDGTGINPADAMEDYLRIRRTEAGP